MRSHSSTFGCQLEKHLESTKREIALVIEECVRYLFQHGMDVEVQLGTQAVYVFVNAVSLK